MSKHNRLQDWARAIRLHQWSKNILIFVPLVLSHQWTNPTAIKSTVLAFIFFGFVVSASYLFNDLNDLEEDRNHPTKCNRPLAAGRIPMWQSQIAMGLLFVGGLCGLIWLSPPLTVVVLLYLLLTTAYSLKIRSIALLDIAAIAALFTLRIVMGIALLSVPPSPWLLSFSLSFFFSLSLAKRHVELRRARFNGHSVSRRGYRRDDWPLTLSFGVAAAVVSIVVMTLYVALDMGGSTGISYHAPQWLYVIPPVVFLWVMRIWLLSHRAELNDDPVIFALRDKPSYALGLLVAIAFALAL